MRYLPFTARLLVVFLTAFAIDVSAQTLSQPTNASLSAVLNSDGSVRPNISGSFDPSGYRLSQGPNGKPLFVREARSAQGGCSDAWDTNFTLNGANSTVQAVVADGLGNVYVGGNFSAVNSVAASRVAKWNGTTWSALGAGLGGGNVEAIAISGSDVYVGGGFTTAGGVPANHIAKWDGNAWSAMGAGLGALGNNFVTSIAVSGTNVFAGGNFMDAGSLNYIARWNGTSWVSLGTGMDQRVDSLAVSGTEVYAGGVFSTAGGVSVPRVARWDGASWSAMGTGVGGATVSALTLSGADIYAGTSVGILAKWNGTSWDSIGTALGGTFRAIRAIAISGTDIYVGGEFTTAGGSPANRIARWNGTQWSPLGVGVGDSILNGVNEIAVLGDTLMVGGSFPTAGGTVAKNIATWSTSAWTAFNGTGLDSSVGVIAVSGTDVYVAGSFFQAGSLAVNRIAKWDGTNWSALGSGLPGDNVSISALVVAGNKVYAGGFFTNIGGVSANYIAVWNGANWAPLGSGVNNSVTAIVVRGEDVFVGGNFTTAGGVSANKIAKWNGTSWSGLNSGVIPTTVTGIAVSGSDLYVSTTTTTTDNPNYFLKYDSTSWTGLGGGMGGHGVTSIAVAGDGYVYISGAFQTVQGIPAVRVARWNGSSWSALGAGLPGNSSGVKLAALGSDLVAIGDFTLAAGGPGDRVAKWNGTTWSAFGAGLGGGNPTAVTVAGGDLWVGGAFVSAGCNLSAYLARWRETVWTGMISTDWHTVSNWGSGSVPLPYASATISSTNASITSADVTVTNLIITGGRTLTIGAGRTLTVNGHLDIRNGTVTGPGQLAVNDLSLNGGDLTNLASVSIDGSLYLNGGKITGFGPVSVQSCSAGAIAGGSNTSFVSSPLRRCVNSSGAFRFPVGTGSTYAPVELRNILGTAYFTIEPKSGAYSDPATGLPANRLQRWWKFTHAGIGTQVDAVFSYADSDIIQTEGRYRVYRISGGAATQLPSSIDTVLNRADASALSEFSSFTLAEGTPAPRTFAGRLTTPNGRGASGVITLTDDQNNVRYAVTNPFGYYRFADVLTFRTYTVQIRSKKFTFAVPSRVVDFDEFTASVNFVSSDN